MMLSSVDLPDPDGPTIASQSPSLIDRFTPIKASTGGSPSKLSPEIIQLDHGWWIADLHGGRWAGRDGSRRQPLEPTRRSADGRVRGWSTSGSRAATMTSGTESTVALA